MIKSIEILYIGKDEKFEGGRTFERISNFMGAFAQSIHRVIFDKFPQVKGMSEDDYKEIEEEVNNYIHSEEAYIKNKEKQLEALAAIATESITTMFQLVDGNDKEVIRAFNNISSLFDVSFISPNLVFNSCLVII